MRNDKRQAVIWSATPTPMNADLSVDVSAIPGLVEHHIQIGVTGLMLGGTCGEGPWMTWNDLEILASEVIQRNSGKMRIAVQVTDHSPRRVQQNIQRMADIGAEIAVVSAPALMMNATPQRILEYYQTIVRNSPLPVGFYDLGIRRPNTLLTEQLTELLHEPNLVLVKDSSGDVERRNIALQVKQFRPELRLLNGDEFNCVQYLKSGYDGLLLGGAIFNAVLAARIAQAVANEDWAVAQQEQEGMNELMYAVYGGKEIRCWMSGLKYLLVRMGIFNTESNHLGYPLDEDCCRAIERVVQTIPRVAEYLSV